MMNNMIFWMLMCVTALMLICLGLGCYKSVIVLYFVFIGVYLLYRLHKRWMNKNYGIPLTSTNVQMLEAQLPRTYTCIECGCERVKYPARIISIDKSTCICCICNSYNKDNVIDHEYIRSKGEIK